MGSISSKAFSSKGSGLSKSSGLSKGSGLFSQEVGSIASEAVQAAQKAGLTNDEASTVDSEQSCLHLARLAGVTKALGDPQRLHVLQALRWHSLNVNELCQVLQVRQSALSHHLKILLRENLVQTRKEGNSTYYRRSHFQTTELRSLVHNALTLLDNSPLDKGMGSRLAMIDQHRSEQAQIFFNQQAKKLRANQELIADFDVYGDAAVSMLSSLGLPSCAQVLELGPGYGEFLTRITAQFESITAVDISDGLIKQARQRLVDQGVSHVEFIHGEIDDLAADKRFDVAVCNMVLHHVSSPTSLLNKLAKRLKPQGHLIVTDLCQHEQSWAQTTCGDRWLGFEPKSLIADGALAGLHHQKQSMIALRNGFQIQLQLFQRCAT